MDLVLLSAIILALGLGLALLLLVRRLGGVPEPLPDADCLARISPARYRPMERLLDPAEEAFVEAAAGRSAARHFRSQRRRIFRCYLRSLERDFGKTCAAVRFLLAHSETDRPELASALMKQQATFAMAVFAVRVRLLLHAAGVGTVDVRGLVGALDTMRAELGRMAPVTSGAAA
jgi:hypothetical protein